MATGQCVNIDSAKGNIQKKELKKKQHSQRKGNNNNKLSYKHCCKVNNNEFAMPIMIMQTEIMII